MLHLGAHRCDEKSRWVVSRFWSRRLLCCAISYLWVFLFLRTHLNSCEYCKGIWGIYAQGLQIQWTTLFQFPWSSLPKIRRPYTSSEPESFLCLYLLWDSQVYQKGRGHISQGREQPDRPRKMSSENQLSIYLFFLL